MFFAAVTVVSLCQNIPGRLTAGLAESQIAAGEQHNHRKCRTGKTHKSLLDSRATPFLGECLWFPSQTGFTRPYIETNTKERKPREGLHASAGRKTVNTGSLTRRFF